MSDTSQGEGWWRASDGKWYPPETHPDYQPPAPPAPEPEPAPPVPPIAETPSPADQNARATIAAPIPQVPPAPAAEPPPAVPPISPDVPAGATIVSPAAPVGGAPPAAGGSILPPSASAIPPAPGTPGAASGGVVENQVPMYVTIVGAVLLFVGLLLPWATLDAFGQSTSVSGLDTDDGKLMLVLAIALIGVTVVYMRTSATWAAILSILVALAALGLTLFEIQDVSGSFEGISVGAGLWVDLIGSVLAVAGSIWAKIDSSN